MRRRFLTKPTVWTGKKTARLWVINGVIYEVPGSHPNWLRDHISDKAKEQYTNLWRIFFAIYPDFTRIVIESDSVSVNSITPGPDLDLALLQILEKHPDVKRIYWDFVWPRNSGVWTVDEFLYEGSSELAKSWLLPLLSKVLKRTRIL